MNKFFGIGRLGKDPDIRYTQGDQPMAVARYTLCVDRRGKGEEKKADFISCVAFGKSAEFAERYLHKGSKIAVEGRIQTGNYKDKDGRTVYTTDVVIESQEFAESRQEGQTAQPVQREPEQQQMSFNRNNEPYVNDGFMSIPEDVDGPGLPWN